MDAPARDGDAFDDDLNARVAAAEADPSCRIGRFVRLGVLGRGGMGAVFEAWDPDLRRRVAIKVLAQNRLGGKTLARFRREAQAIARLRHRGIVDVYELAEVHAEPVIVMECVAGPSLEALASEGIEPERAVTLVAQIARALAHAHGQGIIHRDVKPSNVILDADGTPRLVDFGLARDASDDARLTATGELIGTVSAMGPEQVAAKPDAIGPAVDIWAAGVLLYRLLSGRVPFEGDEAVTVMAGILRGRPPRVTEVAPSVPEPIGEIVERCLAQDPADRWPSAEALAEALEGVAASGGGGSAPARAVAARSKRPFRGRPPPSSAARAPAAARLHPAAIVAVALGLLALAIGIAARLSGDAENATDGPAPDAASASLIAHLTEPEPGAVTGAATIRVVGGVVGDLAVVRVAGRRVAVNESRFEAEVDLPEGVRTIEVTTDAGDAIASVTVVVDRTRPVLELTTPAAGAILTEPRVVVAGTVRDATEVRLALEVDGVVRPDTVTIGEDGAFTASVPVADDREGEVAVVVTATDAAGNVARSDARGHVDLRQPTVRITSPGPTSLTRDSRLEIHGFVRDASAVRVGLAGSEASPVASDGTFVLIAELPEADGPVAFTIVAVDAAGRETRGALEVIRDATAPVVTISAPSEGTIVTESRVKVAGSVSDANGPVEVSVAGTAVPVEAGGAFEHEAPVAETGPTSIEIVATDRAGNVARTTVGVGRAPAPVITLAEPLPERRVGKDRTLRIEGTLDRDAAVSVNGDEVAVRRRKFRTRVRLEPGENPIVIVATGAEGGEGRLEATVLYVPKPGAELWWKPTPAQRAHAEKIERPLSYENELGMRFVLIPPGKLVMGELGQADEMPHEVTITRGYYLAATEVTNAQYRRFDPAHVSGTPPNYASSGVDLNGATQPACEVSWREARDFCRWLSDQAGVPGLYRLPNEAEWELAVRAGTTSRYPWGDGPGSGQGRTNVYDRSVAKTPLARGSIRSWPFDDGYVGTAPVGSFPANPLGLFDMIGNVSEWCGDRHAPFTAEPRTDPVGPEDASLKERVSRGGSFLSTSDGARSAHRSQAVEHFVSTRIGLRVVATDLPPRIRGGR